MQPGPQGRHPVGGGDLGDPVSAGPEAADFLDGEVLIMLDVQVLGFLGWDPIGLPRHQVAKMPDRGLVVMRQVALALGCKKVEDLKKGW